MKQNKNHKLGFTLLELLVVVLIIAILTGIALPQYQKAVIKAKYATVMPIVKAVGESMERYYMIKGSLPVNMNLLDVELESKNIENFYGHDKINFDWGWCFFGWGNQFSCDLEKEKIRFSSYPLTKKNKCHAVTSNITSKEYKFCESLPNSSFEGYTSCQWGEKELPCYSFVLH